MMYQGRAVSLQIAEAGIAELVFDAQGASVNSLTSEVFEEVAAALEQLKGASGIQGLLIRSEKSNFIVGADIPELAGRARQGSAALKPWMDEVHRILCDIESLPYPTVAAMNGLALGGGFEVALAADFRVLAADGRVGLPEVNLGLFPGWGGTVRLSRLIGAEPALSWILGGRPQKAESARQQGAVDAVAEPQALIGRALELLREKIAGAVDLAPVRARKQEPRDLDAALGESLGAKLDPRYPAAPTALALVQRHLALPFAEALTAERDAFLELLQSDSAQALIGLFLNDQVLKRKARQAQKKASTVARAGVLGAGIMGGGIAFQSASTGTPALMKDIRDEALDLGMRTAGKLLDRQVEKGRLDEAGKAKVLAAIEPTLEYSGFDNVDLVVEAVVENPKIKAAVLSEVENALAADAILTSNTSTISINRLAESLQRPQQFCGMHFFNPVHLMQLVEVIRGRDTSEQTLATTVAYAVAMGKTPIVVNDCPGFLVNRILFPYLNGFNRLLLDGVDFQRIDRVMEAFGWPMGPAYLMDVIGLDTCVHADEVMIEGFPERMGHDGAVICEQLVEGGDLGQKSGSGFYTYGTDENGRRTREPSDRAQQLIDAAKGPVVELSDQDIIDRMMIPMCMEAVRCLEDGIADTAAEVDMGLILGLGFPRFRGGALRYVDSLGLQNFCDLVERHAGSGPLYRVTDGLREKAAKGERFFG
ncbi:fatty acid oxidation complex subunit alpha [Marinobacterium nitratireducens]|uniref:enoyl-CoA hydratase n=1 Tax=Marinobacterium nitratireducens TaxID=518897 RepID=A0A917ZF94_9GAMM|nr:fatty acid oxidation complex subunit alpha FadB [Marinobacterium nitratireducens]GGO81457.1 fatty acid oxidation complex subunit alpha [Marinobacterium nitratireducens]